MSRKLLHILGACTLLSTSVNATTFESCPLPGDIHQCKEGTCVSEMSGGPGEWSGKPLDVNKLLSRSNPRATQGPFCEYDTPGGLLRLEMYPQKPYQNYVVSNTPAPGFNCEKSSLYNLGENYK